MKGATMRYLRILCVLTVVVGAYAIFVVPASATGCGSSMLECVIFNATATTTSSSSTSSSVYIREKKSVREKITRYEKSRNMIVLVHVRAQGVKSRRGCVDPVRKGWIHTGGYYDNSGANRPGFYTDTWKVGKQICNARRVKVGNTWYMVGWKDNCSNKIRIPISGPKVFKKYIPILEVRSTREFNSLYEKWITSQTSSTSTTTVTYSCPTGSIKIGDGSKCQQCFTLPVVPCPPEPPKHPPLLSNPVNPEEIFSDGEHYPNICVTVAAKSGNRITVTFGTIYGHFTASMVTITSTGVDRVCTTYIAPVDSSAVGKMEVITYGAHDHTTGLNATPVSSQPFPIKQPPVRP